MKLIELLDFLKIYDTLKGKELPFNLSYKIAKIFQCAQDEVKFYQEKIKEILDKYGEKNESGELISNNGNFQIKKEFMDVCAKEISELQSVEVKCDISFTPEELSTINIIVEEVQVLIPFIK